MADFVLKMMNLMMTVLMDRLADSYQRLNAVRRLEGRVGYFHEFRKELRLDVRNLVRLRLVSNCRHATLIASKPPSNRIHNYSNHHYSLILADFCRSSHQNSKCVLRILTDKKRHHDVLLFNWQRLNAPRPEDYRSFIDERDDMVADADSDDGDTVSTLHIDLGLLQSDNHWPCTLCG